MTAALRIKELAPEIRQVMALADEYPDFSICGIPFCLVREVTDSWHLAHRTRLGIENLGIDLLTGTRPFSVDLVARRCRARSASGEEATINFDKLILATGARSIRPPIEGLDRDGVFILRWMEEARGWGKNLIAIASRQFVVRKLSRINRDRGPLDDGIAVGSIQKRPANLRISRNCGKLVG